MAFNKIISSHSFKMKTVFDVKTFFFVVLEKLKLKIGKPIYIRMAIVVVVWLMCNFSYYFDEFPSVHTIKFGEPRVEYSCSRPSTIHCAVVRVLDYIR